MRAEHKMSYGEASAFTGWRHVVAQMQRAGVRKGIKRLSHRKDRRIAQRVVRAER